MKIYYGSVSAVHKLTEVTAHRQLCVKAESAEEAIGKIYPILHDCFPDSQWRSQQIHQAHEVPMEWIMEVAEENKGNNKEIR